MTDIVTRLRDGAGADGWVHPDVAREAADEIELLTTALEIIAGRQQCIDNLMSHADIARAALNIPKRGEMTEQPMFVVLRRCRDGRWSVAAQDVPGEQRASVLRTWRALGYTVLAVSQPETHNAAAPAR